MDKKKSLLNVGVSIGFQIITMIMVIFVKKMLIQVCGNEVNGLNALYLSIIGFLSVAELGVGSAITFCMYKPIVEGDTQKVSALYCLFKKVYTIVSGIILASGLAITPFIHLLAKDYTELNVDLYGTFILMLLSVVLTYLFASQTALINAYKNNYVTTAISSTGVILQYVLQIVALMLTRSFIWYLTCRIFVVLLQWIATDLITRKKYAPIISQKQKIDEETKFVLMRSVKAMFMHKIGSILVNTIDSVVISIFIGVVALGKYSNYMTIMSAMTTVLSLLFTSLTSVIGHLFVEKGGKGSKRYCEMFHFLNFSIGCIFFLGYYAVIDNLIELLFSADLVIERSIPFIITLNGFVQFMRRSVNLFRDATGTFYNDRWKPLFEGISNLLLSVLFVKIFGITGVIIATIVTNLLICHIVEPYVLYKYAFFESPCKYYIRNYMMIAVFIVILQLFSSWMRELEHIWTEVLVNGFFSVAISVMVSAVLSLMYKNELKLLLKSLRRRS